MMSQRMKTVVVAVVALLLVLSLVVPAFAHAALLGSDPENGETLEMTEQVTLTFNEDINAQFVTVVVEGPAGDVTGGELPEVEGRVVTQPISPSSNGEHVLVYRVVSKDGHPVDGQVTFILTGVPAASPTETPEPTTTEPTTEPTTTEPPTTEPTPASTEATASPEAEVIDDGFTWPLSVLATAGIVLLAVVAGGLVFWNARRDGD